MPLFWHRYCRITRTDLSEYHEFDLSAQYRDYLIGKSLNLSNQQQNNVSQAFNAPTSAAQKSIRGANCSRSAQSTGKRTLFVHKIPLVREHFLSVLIVHRAPSVTYLGRIIEELRLFKSVQAEAKRFAQFCQTARQVYDALEGPFIKSPSPTMANMMTHLGPRGLATLASVGPMRSLWNSLGRHFNDPRLRQLFARYATYCGSSPWEAPATLMLIAQVEMDGVWAVHGGMHALATCLMRLGQAQGVNYVFNSECERIELNQGRVTGVRLASGDSLRADSVVFNGDIAALRKGLLGPGMQKSVQGKVQPRSLSALTWSVHADTGGMALDRHNVFFNSDYASEFDDIFAHKRMPLQPTVYVCAQDRGTGTVPEGAERLLCLVNAPARGDKRMSDDELEACARSSQ
ncbi:MAG: hypothetical protein EBU92_14515, partial [Betaproteobacteria bacterium]|nr:hypothetical protein [Betaproteobacteria bacterium]